MAVVRTRSSPPYGLFTAVALAVIAAGLAVVFYVMYAKAADDLRVADSAAKKAATTADVNSYRNLNSNFDASGNISYLNQANKQIKALSDELAAARASLAQVTADKDRFEKENQSANLAAEQARAERKATLQTADSQRAGTERDKADLKTQLDQKTADSAKAIEARSKAVTDAQAALAKNNDDMEKLRRDTVIQREEDQSTIVRQTAEILDLRQRIQNQRGVSGNPTVGESDGQIVSVNGAAGEAWINLANKDRIMPGMTFTAYDPRTGVRFGTDEAALGNGSLEVIEVGQSSSLCRITRTTKNRAIQAGDLIANLVYHNDRTRKFRFTVLGNFDLDGDGVATAAERDRIILLIQRWGGQVDEDVTSQTDYLVVGSRPSSPMPSLDQPTDTAPATEPATPSSGVVGGIGETASKEQQRYDELIISAKRLAIPVLNANRFLAMIGYYNTTVVRY